MRNTKINNHQKNSEKNHLYDKHEGALFVTYSGTGFFDIPGTTESIRIPRENLNTALHGDTVLIHTYKKNRELYGEVTKIIKRKQLKFTGTLTQSGKDFYVIADNKRFYRPIKISENKEISKKALGHKVYVLITKWEKHDKDPEGKILEVIGKKGLHETEMSAILLEKGFAKTFEHAIEVEAKSFKRDIAPEQIATRRDFRDVTTFTIDPIDAKDFDDAISFIDMGSGKYEIGIHIADVSHFVRPNSIIDDEARERSTSVYMVDRTISMLPEILSNDLCSLVEGKDRLTMSAVFVMDINGGVHKRWFGKTVINSNMRMTYEGAQEILDNKSGSYLKELNILDEITKNIQKRRKREGALSFNQEEVKFVLDEKMRPVDVMAKKRTPSHEIIEELMIMANNEVAHFIATFGKNNNQKEVPAIYRIHGSPKKDRIEELKIFLKLWGYELIFKDSKSLSIALNKLQDELGEKSERTMINSMVIRSMEKAIYSTKNIGHYGLALDEYVHFTSPIRRYPDLMIHRILDNILKNKPTDTLKKLDEIAKHSSIREKEAADAERASIKYKQVEYMSERIGEIFAGTVSGLNDYNIFIEESRTKCEGMMKLEMFKNKNYFFDKKNLRIYSEVTKKEFRVGDKVKIKVVRADMEEQLIEYEIMD